MSPSSSSESQLAPSWYMCGLVIALVMGGIDLNPGPAAAEGATLIGIVTFHGSVPPQQRISVNRDREYCGDTMSLPQITVAGESHGLEQAVVSVSGPELASLNTEPASNVVNNQACAFTPRISAMTIGDFLTIGNNDPVMHNTHIRLEGKTILNVAMVPRGHTIQKTAKDSGILELRCDAHKFMQGYILVFPHRYFTVTNETGIFRIPDVPPGHRQIMVWHEVLGTLRQDVLIPAQGEIKVRFEFAPPINN